jgi:hypothetical protein
VNNHRGFWRLLSVSWYILAGIVAVCGCLPLKLFTTGVLLIFAPHMVEARSDMDIPVGLFLVLFAGGLSAACWACAYCLAKGGRKGARRAMWNCPLGVHAASVDRVSRSIRNLR